ncbi:MAG: hypothetical protein N3G74_01335 [Candidatus Micrarchaeota archaeon]|nr:hypothetical protein [Candidatus Micrarchaeota archaeon]
MAKETMESFGAWAFYLGLIVALVLAVMPTVLSAGWTILILGFLGIIVGLLNIGDKELQLYMIANIAFLVAANGFTGVLTALPVGTGGITFLASFVHNIILFVAPGVAVVALKALYEVAKE